MGSIAKKEKRKIWPYIAAGAVISVVVLILFVVLLFSSFGMLSDYTPSKTAKVAVIKIDGPIVSQDQGGLFAQEMVTPGTIGDKVDKINNDPSIKAVVLEINSPGGSAVASDEIGTKLNKIELPKVALIREVGASGGYWIASTADYIFANRMSITGSIGVIAAYLEFDELMDRYGIEYRRLVAGKYKDLGSPFKEMTEEEQALFQQSLDQIHEYFIEEVVANRDMEVEAVREVATGRIFLGVEAKEVGLVDELGGYDELREYLKKTLEVEDVEFVEYTSEPTFLEALAQAMNERSYMVGAGIGSQLLPANDVAIKT